MGWSQIRRAPGNVGDSAGDGASRSGSAPSLDSAEPRSGEQVVMALTGTDRWPTVLEFEHSLETALATRPRTLVVDMSAVAEVTSSTVAELLRARRVCASRGVDILLRHPSPRCVAALSRVGLLRVLAVESAEPKARLRSGSGGRP